ncbi:MAG: signal recognition particle-docking protein FtsY [Candidatus Devosia symbiotica]|nr:signal recognition particle-docking protein FtsY [Candidatus Devosia symbiotica]
MTDKKPGFFQRLFGSEAALQIPVATPGPEEMLPETVAPAQTPDAIVPLPEPVAAPEPSSGPEHVPLPGPPETTPEYVVALEMQAHDGARALAETAPIAPAEPRGWFARLASGLKRSSDQLTSSISAVFTKRKLDDATLEELENVLIQADLGIETATSIIDTLRRDRFDRDVSDEDVRAVLVAEIEKVLGPVARPLEIDASQKPFIILMIGVNGSGKTTTIGKLAQKFVNEGKSVMLAAGDTFRAAAIEQLQIWGDRTGATVISRPAGSDVSGLAFDAVTQACAEGRDVLIIDTAGRLQNRDELMNELEKVIRVINKVDPGAPHATLLTLDATTGQNALKQVEVFSQRAGVTGLVMTKLDGTARGGILVAIARKFGLLVHFIGVGEDVGDLEAFTAADFAQAIAGRD